MGKSYFELGQFTPLLWGPAYPDQCAHMPAEILCCQRCPYCQAIGCLATVIIFSPGLRYVECQREDRQLDLSPPYTHSLFSTAASVLGLGGPVAAVGDTAFTCHWHMTAKCQWQNALCSMIHAHEGGPGAGSMKT